MTPRISFIVTAYNRPNALRTCLSSLVEQTMPDWEALVVDNSTDPASARVQQILTTMDERITYELTEPRTRIHDAIHKNSLYVATEIGIGMTSAPWLVFPNDDSYYCPWFAERMLEHSAGLDLVFCDIVAGGPGGHHHLTAEPKLCSIDKTNIMLRRDWFHGFSHDPQDYPMADGLLVLDLVSRGARYGRLPQILVVHN